MQSLTLVVAKGRVLREALVVLNRAGICPAEDPSLSRCLIQPTNHPHLRLLICRSPDVPVYVGLGAAELGIVGSDILLEYGSDGLYDPLDLGIGTCRMMLAAPRNRRTAAPTSTRVPAVATKYPRVTRRFFAAKSRQADIIRLYGSLELAPMVGLADYVVDLVDTGRTLEAHGLEPIEKVADISARLIINKAAMKVKDTAVRELLGKLQRAVDQSPDGAPA